MGVEWWEILERMSKTMNIRLRESLEPMGCDIVTHPHFAHILEFKYQRKSEEEVKERFMKIWYLLNVEYFDLKAYQHVILSPEVPHLDRFYIFQFSSDHADAFLLLSEQWYIYNTD